MRLAVPTRFPSEDVLIRAWRLERARQAVRPYAWAVALAILASLPLAVAVWS